MDRVSEFCIEEIFLFDFPNKCMLFFYSWPKKHYIVKAIIEQGHFSRKFLNQIAFIKLSHNVMCISTISSTNADINPKFLIINSNDSSNSQKYHFFWRSLQRTYLNSLRKGNYDLTRTHPLLVYFRGNFFIGRTWDGRNALIQANCESCSSDVYLSWLATSSAIGPAIGVGWGFDFLARIELIILDL